MPAGGMRIDGGVRIEGLNALVRDLSAMGVEVADIKDAFGAIAAQAARLAAGYAPRRTGRLQASIKGSRAKNRATVRAGGARVPYAAAINYGWPRRNITASGFMQRTDEAIRPTVGTNLQRAIDRMISQRGMS